MKLGLILCAILAGSCFAQQPAGVSTLETREVRELRMAEQSILASLSVGTSPKGRYLCTDNELACLGGDKAELGLALIGARNTSASLKSLAGVMRFSLDGSLGEDYPCYVLGKGRSVRPYLASLKPAELETQCRSEFEHLAKTTKSLEGVKPESICADAQSIKNRTQDLLQAIDKGKKCSVGDF